MSFIGQWKDKIAHYIDVHIGLLKLGFIEKTSNILSYLIFVFISLFLAVAILIFLGVGLGEWFSVLVGSRAGGYFITAGVYILVMVLLIAMRNSLIKAFSGIFIRIMTEPDPDDEEIQERTRKDIKVD